VSSLLRVFKLVRSQHCLTQYTAQSSDCNFAMFRYNGRNDALPREFHKLSMTATTRPFFKSCGLNLRFDKEEALSDATLNLGLDGNYFRKDCGNRRR